MRRQKAEDVASALLADMSQGQAFARHQTPGERHDLLAKQDPSEADQRDDRWRR